MAIEFFPGEIVTITSVRPDVPVKNEKARILDKRKITDELEQYKVEFLDKDFYADTNYFFEDEISIIIPEPGDYVVLNVRGIKKNDEIIKELEKNKIKNKNYILQLQDNKEFFNIPRKVSGYVTEPNVVCATCNQQHGYVTIEDEYYKTAWVCNVSIVDSEKSNEASSLNESLKIEGEFIPTFDIQRDWGILNPPDVHDGNLYVDKSERISYEEIKGYLVIDDEKSLEAPSLQKVGKTVIGHNKSNLYAPNLQYIYGDLKLDYESNMNIPNLKTLYGSLDITPTAKLIVGQEFDVKGQIFKPGSYDTLSLSELARDYPQNFEIRETMYTSESVLLPNENVIPTFDIQRDWGILNPRTEIYHPKPEKFINKSLIFGDHEAPYCGEVSPHHYNCTRKRYHSGQHEAASLWSKQLDIWSNNPRSEIYHPRTKKKISSIKVGDVYIHTQQGRTFIEGDFISEDIQHKVTVLHIVEDFSVSPPIRIIEVWPEGSKHENMIKITDELYKNGTIDEIGFSVIEENPRTEIYHPKPGYQIKKTIMYKSQKKYIDIRNPMIEQIGEHYVLYYFSGRDGSEKIILSATFVELKDAIDAAFLALDYVSWWENRPTSGRFAHFVFGIYLFREDSINTYEVEDKRKEPSEEFRKHIQPDNYFRIIPQKNPRTEIYHPKPTSYYFEEAPPSTSIFLGDICIYENDDGLYDLTYYSDNIFSNNTYVTNNREDVIKKAFIALDFANAHEDLDETFIRPKWRSNDVLFKGYEVFYYDKRMKRFSLKRKTPPNDEYKSYMVDGVFTL